MRRSLLLLPLLVLSTASCGNPVEDTYGRELYESVCSACHGTRGSGSELFPAIGSGSNAVTLRDDQIAGVVRVGPGAMPSYQRLLTTEQVESLVAYVRELQDAD